jgi:DNA-binding response OmpR family regulator
MAKVLVIEDSLTEATYISSSLRQEGFDVTTVNTAEDAKKAAKEASFEAIWMDVVLPDGSGFGLCRYFRKNSSTKNTPIVMCTSKGTDVDKEWGTKQGASVYLTKPVDSKTIVETIKSFIG